MFEVKNAINTIQYLKQFDYGKKSINWTQDILSKLDMWEKQISMNPLLFENPATNFLLLKMLRMDGYPTRYGTKSPQGNIQKKCQSSLKTRS